MPKNKKQAELEDQVAQLTADLQRTRADFENYSRRADVERTNARQQGSASTILKVLPLIDTIDRAIAHIPAELETNKWVQGIASTQKNIDKLTTAFNLSKIDASVGSVFDPELHEAVQFDEEAEGDTEIIAEELQSGYKLDGSVIRHAMVKVTKK